MGKNKKFIKPIALTKKNTLVLIAAIFVLFIILYSNEKSNFKKQENIGTRLGEHAPDFKAEYLNGEKITFSGLMEKPIILNFWASWCLPCRREMPLLQRLHDKGKIMVVGVNMQEDRKTVEKFVNKLNITFPIVLDKDGSIEARYNILLKPTTYFIDGNGVIADKRYGELTSSDLEERGKKLLK